MRWLNYHHLLYFWTVAREGSVTKACKELRLAQPTVSAQLKALEESLGERLFEKEGRYLKLTETGKLVYRYADEIFGIGRELLAQLDGKPAARSHTLKVGVVDVMPKLVAFKLLDTALQGGEQAKLLCYEDSSEKLLADLALHEVDLVLADAPISPNIKVKAYNHYLGECGVSFLATDQLAKQHSKGFPKSLHKAPLFLPIHEAAIRREIDHWLDSIEVAPNLIGEFQDTTLMKIFAKAGHAILPVPSCIEAEICEQYDLKVVGRTEDVKDRFYLISVERRVKNPLVVRICEEAHKRIF